MARDHRRLRVFQEAHDLSIAIYQHTRSFPRDEWFGLRAQMRRAAVSITSNLVEGNARRTTRDYLSFLNIARGSASELEYLLQLSAELNYLPSPVYTSLKERCERLIPQLEALVQKMGELQMAEETHRKARLSAGTAVRLPLHSVVLRWHLSGNGGGNRACPVPGSSSCRQPARPADPHADGTVRPVERLVGRRVRNRVLASNPVCDAEDDALDVMHRGHIVHAAASELGEVLELIACFSGRR